VRIVNIATHLVEQFERGGYTRVDPTGSVDQDFPGAMSSEVVVGDTGSEVVVGDSAIQGGVSFSTEAAQAEAAQKGQDLRDAEKAGFLAKNYNNIGPNAVAAWKQSLADEQDRLDYEESVAAQATDIAWSPSEGYGEGSVIYEPGDLTNQEEFFQAIGISDKAGLQGAGWKESTYENIATALAPEGTDVAEFIDPQGTAAAEAALEIQQENTARDTLLTEKQETPEHRAASSMGGQSHEDAMAEIRRIEEDYNLERLAGGGRVGSQEMAIVGESGPEVALLPHGTEVIPLDRNVQPAQARRLRRRGVRGMQDGGQAGGIVFDRYGGELPSGVRRTVAGQSVDPSAGRLFRAAGLGVPSGQGLRNMLPEDLDIYKDLGAQAGIPEGSFQRELALGIPSGERQRGSARFLPLSLRS
jgi:hypothetical protein